MTLTESNRQSATPMNRKHATKVGVGIPQSEGEIVVSVRGLAGAAKGG